MARTPTGLGLDSHAVRLRMAERLRRQGIRSEVLLQAMVEVPRHLFVDSAFAFQAYEDTSLPIGHGQTISKPFVVARMIDLLLGSSPSSALAPAVMTNRPLGKVLEIGTGCGYQAAVLARLSREVVSIERIQALHEQARDRLKDLAIRQVRLLWGDGREGAASAAPFDHIIAAAGGEALPQAWLDQLQEGGRLVAPMHSREHGGQVLVLAERRQGEIHRSVHDGVHFVPLDHGRR
jgi:protein-L-isoaspartate(D-aspartate) O-methyltransferase